MTKSRFSSNLNTPVHYFQDDSHYMITASTYHRTHLLNTHEKKQFVCVTILEQTTRYHWTIQAWCVLSNHYHLIARAPENAASLSHLIRSIHSITARYMNMVDRKIGRRVWLNYWDTCITNEKSFLARLKYVHCNAVRHRIGKYPEDYPYSSYAWFISNSSTEERERVLKSPIDQLDIEF